MTTSSSNGASAARLARKATILASGTATGLTDGKRTTPLRLWCLATIRVGCTNVARHATRRVTHFSRTPPVCTTVRSVTEWCIGATLAIISAGHTERGARGTLTIWHTGITHGCCRCLTTIGRGTTGDTDSATFHRHQARLRDMQSQVDIIETRGITDHLRRARRVRPVGACRQCPRKHDISPIVIDQWLRCVIDQSQLLASAHSRTVDEERDDYCKQ